MRWLSWGFGILALRHFENVVPQMRNGWVGGIGSVGDDVLQWGGDDSVGM
jgi:hypothetical protein